MELLGEDASALEGVDSMLDLLDKPVAYVGMAGDFESVLKPSGSGRLYQGA